MKKTSLVIFTLWALFNLNLKAQNMQEQFVNTSIGKIAVQMEKVEGSTPIIFLHGVYLDHHLWDQQVSEIHDRTVITVDMPFHGNSKEISKRNWKMEDVSRMLIEILDSLEIKKVYAIGHSWGSMTILRAAAAHPERFEAIGLCNLPYEASNPGRRLQFRMQHSMLPFRGFYARQVAKAMFGEQSLKQNPSLEQSIGTSMGKLKGREIRQTDKSVIIRAEDSSPLLTQVQDFALALKGKEDYVPNPSQYIDTKVVEGGHISPLEVPQEVNTFVKKVLAHKSGLSK